MAKTSFRLSSVAAAMTDLVARGTVTASFVRENSLQPWLLGGVCAQTLPPPPAARLARPAGRVL